MQMTTNNSIRKKKQKGKTLNRWEKLKDLNIFKN